MVENQPGAALMTAEEKKALTLQLKGVAEEHQASKEN